METKNFYRTGGSTYQPPWRQQSSNSSYYSSPNRGGSEAPPSRQYPSSSRLSGSDFLSPSAFPTFPSMFNSNGSVNMDAFPRSLLSPAPFSSNLPRNFNQSSYEPGRGAGLPPVTMNRYGGRSTPGPYQSLLPTRLTDSMPNTRTVEPADNRVYERGMTPQERQIPVQVMESNKSLGGSSSVATTPTYERPSPGWNTLGGNADMDAGYMTDVPSNTSSRYQRGQKATTPTWRSNATTPTFGQQSQRPQSLGFYRSESTQNLSAARPFSATPAPRFEVRPLPVRLMSSRQPSESGGQADQRPQQVYRRHDSDTTPTQANPPSPNVSGPADGGVEMPPIYGSVHRPKTPRPTGRKPMYTSLTNLADESQYETGRSAPPAPPPPEANPVAAFNAIQNSFNSLPRTRLSENAFRPPVTSDLPPEPVEPQPQPRSPPPLSRQEFKSKLDNCLVPSLNQVKKPVSPSVVPSNGSPVVIPTDGNAQVKTTQKQMVLPHSSAAVASTAPVATASYYPTAFSSSSGTTTTTPMPAVTSTRRNSAQKIATICRPSAPITASSPSPSVSHHACLPTTSLPVTLDDDDVINVDDQSVLISTAHLNLRTSFDLTESSRETFGHSVETGSLRRSSSPSRHRLRTSTMRRLFNRKSKSKNISDSPTEASSRGSSAKGSNQNLESPSYQNMTYSDQRRNGDATSPSPSGGVLTHQSSSDQQIQASAVLKSYKRHMPAAQVQSTHDEGYVTSSANDTAGNDDGHVRLRTPPRLQTLWSDEASVALSSPSLSPSSLNNAQPAVTTVEIPPVCLAFDEICKGSLAEFFKLSDAIGDDVQTMSGLVNDAFTKETQFLFFAAGNRKPSDSDLEAKVKPISESMQAIQEFREKQRRSKLFNHLSAVSESIAALGWVMVTPTPAPYIKEMVEASQFYTNRVLKDYKEVDTKHVDWAKAWLKTLSDLQAFVKANHTTGLVWNSNPGCDVGSAGPTPPAVAPKGPPPPPKGAAPPPPPPGPPPPPVPSMANGDGAGKGSDDSRSQLLDQINRGTDITQGLKKVTSEMQTHKNPDLRAGSTVPDKKPAIAPKPKMGAGGAGAAAAPKPVKPPKLELEGGKKWVVEYYRDNKNIKVSVSDNKQSVYIYNCIGSVIVVTGKANSVVLDTCKKTAVVFDSLVAACEIINSQSVDVQSQGTMPTVSVDKTDGCQIYLSKDSVNCEVVTAKSSAMNVLVPDNSGDFKEFPVPEQFKTIYAPSTKKLVTSAVDNA